VNEEDLDKLKKFTEDFGQVAMLINFLFVTVVSYSVRHWQSFTD